jgi:4-diphosphocytidyl-2-C-methyl-D-erythritol kinase
MYEIETSYGSHSACDALEMIIDSKTTFESTGLSIPGESKDNLKAFSLLKKDFLVFLIFTDSFT